MTTSSSLLALAVILILVLMAWIGWRFFLRGDTSGFGSSAEFGHAIAPHTAGPATGISSGAGVGSAENLSGPGTASPPGDRSSWRLPSRRLSLRRLRVRMRSTQRPVFITAGSLALVGAVVLLTSRIDTRHLDRALAPTPAQTDERISIALSGVDLVPTPPLPPSMFLDVLRDYPLVADANRDWSRLDPAFAGVLSQLIERMKIRGYEMVLLEGYRSPERQDLLAGLGPHVSQAEGGRSKHQYGLAADLAFLRDGRAVISERDPWALQGYQVLGVEARAAGLVWGGDWTMRDYGHVEQASGGSVLARR